MLRITLTTLILSASFRYGLSLHENNTSSRPGLSTGIPPCLFPPFQNLVYNFEASVLGRPGLRTGCYVSADSNGRPFPHKTLSPLSTVNVLRYYAIDSTGIQQTVSTHQKTALCLQEDPLSTSNRSNCINFDFHQVCFPELCYSSEEMWAKSCFYPFLGPAGCTLCDSPHHTSQVDQQPDGGHSMLFAEESAYLGRSSYTYDSWLYCTFDENGVRKTVPVMSKKFPFGLIQNLKRIPDLDNFQGSTVVLTFKHFGLDVVTNLGCDVVLPLEAPSDKFMHRFWYRNEKLVEVTIGINETGIVKKRLPSNPEGGSYEIFTFHDLCFPEECYIERRINCTGKFDGGREPWKRRIVKYVSTVNGKTTIISENTV